LGTGILKFRQEFSNKVRPGSFNTQGLTHILTTLGLGILTLVTARCPFVPSKAKLFKGPPMFAANHGLKPLTFYKDEKT